MRTGRPIENLVSQSFNRLTVVGHSRSASGKPMWECKCDCGATTVVRGSHLKTGQIKSCGCMLHEGNADALIVGARYGRLVVVGQSKRRGSSRNILWRLACDCGNETLATPSNVKSGNTESCGCLRSILTSLRKRKARHYHRALHVVWEGMKQRCHNPNNSKYSYYGGRGITVCERWRDSFEAFLADMGERPTPKHTIDRKDNDGHYCPDNCVWATRMQQTHNRRKKVA